MSEETKKDIESLRILARRARHDQENDKSAVEYYEKILLADPNDWEAYFFSNTFKIVDDLRSHEMEQYEFDEYEVELFLSEESLSRLKNVLEITLQLLSEHRDDTRCEYELSEICTELERVTMLSTTPMSAMLAACTLAERPELYAVVADMYVDIVFEQNTDIMFFFAEHAMGTFNNEKAAARAYYINKIHADALKEAVYYRDLDSTTKSKLSKVRKKIDDGVQPLVKKRVDEYWEQHAEEKQQLLTEKAELLEKLNKLKRGIDELKGSEYKQEKKNITEMNSHLSTLEGRYNKLGFFKKKEKEELQKLINEARVRLRTMEAAVAEKDEVIVPLQKEHDAIRNRIIKIEAHFSKVEREETESFLKQNEGD